MTSQQIENIQGIQAQADEWWMNETWGFAVGRFGAVVVNYELSTQGEWWVENVTEWLGPKRASRDFAREVRAFEKANA